ncbi:hypothetical protein [Acrocarpospora pleiomorpha]|nr:hypothetical protein [Acrocarpospora pleiomorpha]
MTNRGSAERVVEQEHGLSAGVAGSDVMTEIMQYVNFLRAGSTVIC